MTPTLTAARIRPAVFLLLATGTLACGCGRDPAPPDAPVRVTDVQPRTSLPPALAPPRVPDTLRTAAPAPLDPAAMVFDTVAPPRLDPPVAAPSRSAEPAPRPLAPRPPAPTARPPARAAAHPPDPGLDTPTASCDVRPAEGYCFAYTGPAWTPATAAANCASAPGATFRATACPTSGRIATCTFRRPSDPDRELVYTTYAPANLDLARLACPGTFEPVE